MRNLREELMPEMQAVPPTLHMRGMEEDHIKCDEMWSEAMLIMQDRHTEGKRMQPCRVQKLWNTPLLEMPKEI